MLAHETGLWSLAFWQLLGLLLVSFAWAVLRIKSCANTLSRFWLHLHIIVEFLFAMRNLRVSTELTIIFINQPAQYWAVEPLLYGASGVETVELWFWVLHLYCCRNLLPISQVRQIATESSFDLSTTGSKCLIVVQVLQEREAKATALPFTWRWPTICYSFFGVCGETVRVFLSPGVAVWCNWCKLKSPEKHSLQELKASELICMIALMSTNLINGLLS